MDIASLIAKTALDAIDVLQQNDTMDWPDDGTIFDNSTDTWPGPITGTPIDVDQGLPATNEGNYILNTFIGLLIVLMASLLNALGLNLTKLDHIRQQSIPRGERRRDIFRILWLAGMGTYIASQVFGSPLALRYLRPDWVAPLGSSSLIFNFIFAYWLVGTPVTSTDINGTAVIVLGVILILVFSSINHGLSQTIDIPTLNELWTRASWLAYYVFLIVFTGITYFISHLLAALLASRASYSPLPSPTIQIGSRAPAPSNTFKQFFGRMWQSWKGFERRVLSRFEGIFNRTQDSRLIWLQGIGWSVCGGSLAGLCLVFTKVIVKIFSLPDHPLVHPSAIFSLLSVIFTAVLQIVCLNRALACADTVVVVPLFYAGYTVFGFINSLIFFDQTKQYARWVLFAVFFSIAVLISGVVLLSLKSSAKTAGDPYTVTSESNSIHLRPQHSRAPQSVHSANGSKGGSKDDENGQGGYGHFHGSGPDGQDVMWEVGSDSDSEDDAKGAESKRVIKADGRDEAEDADEEEQPERRGVGGGQDGRGERRGLLGEEEEIDDDTVYIQPGPSR